ncbi:MAG: ABC transporter permease [Dehalococcoidales bacterium]|nr:ABC transporter permease [Dehalococcoidales bacterium]
MQFYIIRRILLVIPTLFLVTIIVFFLVRFIPANTVDIMLADQEGLARIDRAALMERLGLNVPVYVQYGRWLGNLVRGDIGQSLWTNRPVIDELKQRLPVSLELGFLAIIIGQIIAIPIGIFSAIRQDSLGDHAGRSIAILFLCVPNFWLGTLIMVYPAIWWHWSPAMTLIKLSDNLLGNLGMFLLPALIMGLHASGNTMRMTRTMMLEVLKQDYIRTAWSKGLSERVVVIRHTLRNALIPVVTMIGMQIPILISGTVIMEQIFNLPGMGTLMLDALQKRDYPIISGVNLFIATFVLVTNLAVDVSYSYLDPRIRYR